MSHGSEEEAIQALIVQCKSNDVDQKIRALTNLQSEFENGTAVSSSDSVVNTLKTCLRTSNSQLYTPAVATIHSFLKLIERSIPRPDTIITRQLLTAFLPTGGVIDRLGDSREKTRENARNIVATIGYLCYNSAGGIQPPTVRAAQKAIETPLVQFERLFREVGFGSKIWRVREQSIQIFLQIRRSIPTFPLRPFLTPLVQTLQDSDGNVRECARKSVIAIFSTAGVAEAAKADLKREIERQNIRKGLSEEILAGVLGNKVTPVPEARIPLPPSRHTTELDIKASAEGDEAFVPHDSALPDSAVPQTRSDGDIPAVYIASTRDLEQEFSRMLVHFEGKETEHNWQDRERSIIRLRGMLKGDIHRRYEDVFMAGLKQNIIEATFKPLTSLRTTLASQTCALYTDLAENCKTAIDPFVDTLLQNLLRLSGYTKKIIASLSQSTVSDIIRNTSAQSRIVVPLICGVLHERTPQSRAFGVEHIKTFLETHAARSRSMIESNGGLETLEKAIHKGLTDPSPLVREPARVCFWAFYSIWPERASLIMEKLDLTARKQLQKSSPSPDVSNGLPTTPEPKKSSVAAAIAASRAKAKQIAAAPPSLRHQATSTSHFSHVNPQGPPMSRTTSAPASGSPRSIRTVSSGSKFAPVKKGRTPSTTTLPASSDGSARGTPSPPLSQGSGPAESHMKKSSNTKSSKGARFPPSPRAAMTPSKIRDAASHMASAKHTRPTSPPFSVSSGHDERVDESFSLISFSSPSTKLGSRALSSSLSLSEPEPAIEEELRAISAQAEAAAEQLLDLTQSNSSSPRSPGQTTFANGGGKAFGNTVIQTPPRRASDKSFIWSQAKAFENSPLPDRGVRIAVEERPRSQNNWWLRVKTLLENNGTSAASACQISGIPRLIGGLGQNQITKEELFSLFWFCRNNSTLPGTDLPESPIYSSIDKVLHAVLGYITRIKAQQTDNLHVALLILWEVGEHWTALLNGNELELYQALLSVRKVEDAMVLEATNALRDSMGTSTDPVYGLSTLHACLNESLKQASSPSSTIGTYVFGLNGINKFVLRLPAQVLEEELPRIRPLILKSLSHENSLVRSAASMVVVSAQMVLQDQAHLFALLDGLSEEKKNFLTYLFDKNKTQTTNGTHSVDDAHTAHQKMEQEVSRLDGRVNPR